MPRGGQRQGAPGQSYTNRTDLNGATAQPVQAGPSKSYGSRVQQEAAQSAIPLPGAGGPLDRPTERPNEPVHAGLTSGPGPGREALGMVGGPGTDALYDLKRLYQFAPDEGLAAIIERLEIELGMR